MASSTLSATMTIFQGIKATLDLEILILRRASPGQALMSLECLSERVLGSGSILAFSSSALRRALRKAVSAASA
eukprot:2787170-Pleurochrysis_carterae.AAC.1